VLPALLQAFVLLRLSRKVLQVGSRRADQF
jgi:hypothetical protein